MSQARSYSSGEDDASDDQMNTGKFNKDYVTSKPKY